VRHGGGRGTRHSERLQRGRLVQRRKRRQALERCDDRIVDAHWVAEDPAAVDDSVADRVEARRYLVERLDGLRSAGLVDERQLEARRARVDDQDAAQNGQTQLRTSG
jgi:hypothetical protein